jgi:cytochrome c553
MRRLCAGLVAVGVFAGLGMGSLAAKLPKGDKAFGEYLSSECVTCHQLSGKVVGGVPAIIGWPEDQFVAVMLSYKNKDRPNAVMQTIAGKFSEEELAALAAYFSSVKPR